MYISMYELIKNSFKRYFLSLILKPATFLRNFISVGKLFHILTTRFENDLCPVLVLKRGMFNNCEFQVFLLLTPPLQINILHK